MRASDRGARPARRRDHRRPDTVATRAVTTRTDGQVGPWFAPPGSRRRALGRRAEPVAPSFPGWRPDGSMQPRSTSSAASGLDEQADGTTRLVVGELSPSLPRTLVMFQPIVAISWPMTQTMLRELRDRVARGGTSTAAVAVADGAGAP